jgi:hypothetical protein
VGCGVSGRYCSSDVERQETYCRPSNHPRSGRRIADRRFRSRRRRFLAIRLVELDHSERPIPGACEAFRNSDPGSRAGSVTVRTFCRYDDGGTR